MEIEYCVAAYFDWRRCVIVPNVSWGMLDYEADLLVMTGAGCLYEVEIKCNRADIKRDLKKRHGHRNNLTRGLYFAIPEKLENCITLIPDHAGVLLVRKTGLVEESRKPLIKKHVPKLKERDRYTLVRLASMRIWTLTKTIIYYNNDSGRVAR